MLEKESNSTPGLVMVVDDNTDGAHTLSLLVKALGYEVRTCNSGADALRVAGLASPRLVLLDLSMPDMDGFETCRRLRLLDSKQPMTIIALSGYSVGENIALSRESGFDQYLVKPLSLTVLKELLARYV